MDYLQNNGYMKKDRDGVWQMKTMYELMDESVPSE